MILQRVKHSNRVQQRLVYLASGALCLGRKRFILGLVDTLQIVIRLWSIKLMLYIHLRSSMEDSLFEFPNDELAELVSSIISENLNPFKKVSRSLFKCLTRKLNVENEMHLCQSLHAFEHACKNTTFISQFLVFLNRSSRSPNWRSTRRSKHYNSKSASLATFSPAK